MTTGTRLAAMARSSKQAAGRPAPNLAGHREGVVTRSDSTGVRARILTGDPGTDYLLRGWETLHGGALPPVGTVCLLAFPADGAVWVTAASGWPAP